MVCMAKTRTVKNFIRILRDNGCHVQLDMAAGTAVAKDGDTVVYRAIRKGKSGQPWIVRCESTERFQWK